MKKPSKKPVKKLLIVGLIVIVAGAAGLTAWLLNRETETETKNYAAAQSATQELRASYDQLEKTFNAYTDDTQTADEKAALDKAYDDYQTKLGAYKSKVESIGDAKITEAYQDFVAKSDAFTSYVDGYVEHYAAAQALTDAQCVAFDFEAATKRDASVVSAFDKEVKACQIAVATLKSSDNKGLADYGTALEKYFQERRAKLNTLQELAMNPDPVKLQEAFAAFVSIAQPELTKELAEAREDAGLIQEFERLSTLVAEKAAGSKPEK